MHIQLIFKDGLQGAVTIKAKIFYNLHIICKKKFSAGGPNCDHKHGYTIIKTSVYNT